jgi:hypothetical protein
MGCKTINFDRFRGNTANKEFCRVRIDLQNVVVILVLRFATLQNKLATAVIFDPEVVATVRGTITCIRENGKW